MPWRGKAGLWLSYYAVTLTSSSRCFSLAAAFLRVIRRKSCVTLATTTMTRLKTRAVAATPPIDSDQRLLRDWMQHDALDFHYFAPDEAAAIRVALLDWYDQHRRPLPWRGDAPPWQGSTVDFASKTSSKTNHKNSNKNQTKIHDFFVKDEKNASSSADTGNDDASDINYSAFPVTPYGVWVSEVMLQQTRVEAVVPYYCRWMTSFPTPAALAAATQDQVNAHFAGLGFYRRARLLHQACQYVCDQYDGVMPSTSQELQDLPGIGRYTACAIASMAHDEPVAVVDGNVCRVLARLRGICQHIKAPAFKDKLAWELAQQLMDAGDASRPGDLNQAMMELGATYCAPAGTGTDANDPLGEFYWSTRLGKAYLDGKRKGAPLDFVSETKNCPVCANHGVQQALERMDELWLEKQDNSKVGQSFDMQARQCGHATLPLPPPKPTRREEVLAVAVLSSDDSYLLVKRPSSGLLAGQWEFPATCVWTSETKVASNAKVPEIAPGTRRKELNTLLTEILTDNVNVKLLPRSTWQSKRQVHDVPAEHVFSHIRHTMWIESKEIALDDYGEMPRQWQDCQGREVRWMNADEMSQVGITSGVKKILKIIKGKSSPQTKTKKQRTR